MLNDQLIEAIEQNNFGTVKYLVSCGADIRADNDHAVRYASKNGHLDTVKYLVSLGASDEYAVASASQYGHLDILKYLVPLDGNTEYAIEYASLNGHLDVVKYLVSSGVEFYCDGEAIGLASRYGHFNVVKYLVSIGVDFRASNDYAVRQASLGGHLEIVKYLVSLGANVNAVHQINKIVNFSYDSGDFDYAIKLSKHRDFKDDTIKKSLAKIQKSREYFMKCFSKNRYANICIVTNNLYYSDK